MAPKSNHKGPIVQPLPKEQASGPRPTLPPRRMGHPPSGTKGLFWLQGLHRRSSFPPILYLTNACSSSSLGLTTKDFPSSFPRPMEPYKIWPLPSSPTSSLPPHSLQSHPTSLLAVPQPCPASSYLLQIYAWFVPSPLPGLCSNTASSERPLLTD